MQSSQSIATRANANLYYILSIVFFTEASTQLIDFSLPLIVYDLTKSAHAMSALRALQFVPDIALAFFIGSLVDSQRKMRGMRFAFLGLGLSLVGLFFYFKWGQDLNLICLHFLTLVFFSFHFWYQNLRQTSIKLALATKDLMRANSYISAIDEILVLMAPAVGGLIIAFSSAPTAMLLAIVLLAFGAFVTNLVKFNEEEILHTFSWRKIHLSVGQGLNAVWHNKPLLHLAFYTSFSNACLGVFNITILFHLRDALGFNSFTTGMALGAMGAGGILAAFTTVRLRHWLSLSRLFVFSPLATGVAVFATLFFSGIIGISVMLLLIGFSSTVYVISVLTYRFESVDAPIMGRVIALTSAMFKISMPIFIYVSGILSDSMGTPAVLKYTSSLFLLLFVGMLFDKRLNGIR